MESKPEGSKRNLEGKRFISTRPEGRSDELASLITAEGGILIHWPLIEIKEKEPAQIEIDTLKNINKTKWLIFTSVNGVEFFFNSLDKFSDRESLDSGIKFAVFGSKTHQLLRDFGFDADFISNSRTGVEFAAELKNSGLLIGQKVLFPCGELASDDLNKELSDIADFERLEVYRTLLPEAVDGSVSDLIRSDQYEMIIFTSPSGFNNFCEIFNSGVAIQNLRAACLGKTTAVAMESRGLKPLIVGKNNDIRFLVKGILAYYGQEGSRKSEV